MFFWIVLRFLFHSLVDGGTWIVYVAANLILYLIFAFFLDIDSISAILILMVGYCIVPYFIVAVCIFCMYFGIIILSPIKYWWFFFKPIRDHNLEISFPNERQWLKDNLDREDFILFGSNLYFKNKDDAVLYRLSAIRN